MSLQPITSKILSFLWVFWNYCAVIEESLQLSSFTLKLPPFIYLIFFLRLMLAHYCPALQAMRDDWHKNFMAKYFLYWGVTLFNNRLYTFCTSSRYHEKCQQQCNYRWHALSLFLSLAQLPSWRVRSHAENCIFHVTHALAVTCMQILAPENLFAADLMGVQYGL